MASKTYAQYRTSLVASSGDGRIDLKWQKTSRANSSGYNILKYINGFITSSIFINDRDINEYTDFDVENGTLYGYIVREITGVEDTNRADAIPASDFDGKLIFKGTSNRIDFREFNNSNKTILN